MQTYKQKVTSVDDTALPESQEDLFADERYIIYYPFVGTLFKNHFDKNNFKYSQDHIFLLTVFFSDLYYHYKVGNTQKNKLFFQTMSQYKKRIGFNRSQIDTIHSFCKKLGDVYIYTGVRRRSEYFLKNSMINYINSERKKEKKFGIKFYPKLNNITNGNIRYTVILSYFLHLDSVFEGKIIKSYKDISKETLIPIKSVRSCVNFLLNRKLIKIEHGQNKNSYQCNKQKILNLAQMPQRSKIVSI